VSKWDGYNGDDIAARIQMVLHPDEEAHRTDDIVQQLHDWQHIVDESKGDAVVVMLSGRVFGDAAAEIKRLRRWKAEATEVLTRWDAVADMVPARIGDRKSDAVADEIERLRAASDAVSALSDDSELILSVSQDYVAGRRDGWREAVRQIKSVFHPEEARRG
jgi:hypothetical protein